MKINHYTPSLEIISRKCGSIQRLTKKVQHILCCSRWNMRLIRHRMERHTPTLCVVRHVLCVATRKLRAVRQIQCVAQRMMRVVRRKSRAVPQMLMGIQRKLCVIQQALRVAQHNSRVVPHIMCVAQQTTGANQQNICLINYICKKIRPIKMSINSKTKCDYAKQ
jgi:hypothetical protein